jgi:ring-1,2-phenylacetyl-CoA epoxidase subunit PaaD
MGILRGVTIADDKVTVTVTPTYSGCPAMYEIRRRIVEELKDNGIVGVKIDTVLSPAWTTDWMTEETKIKLKDYGIAPPEKTSNDDDFLTSLSSTKVVPCPFCDSFETKLQSQFGSTACKSQYFCNSCNQPFEHFKCI